MSLRLRLGVVDGSPMRIITQEFIGLSSSLGYSRAVGYSRDYFKKPLITIGYAYFWWFRYFSTQVCVNRSVLPYDTHPSQGSQFLTTSAVNRVKR